MNIRPVGTELFHADGQTDMTELIITFRNFASAPKQQRQTYALIVTIPQRKTTEFCHSSRNISALACQAAATPKPVSAFLR
jgi:hypothetical protein